MIYVCAFNYKDRITESVCENENYFLIARTRHCYIGTGSLLCMFTRENFDNSLT